MRSRVFFDPSVTAIEAINPSVTGYLGGLGLPILVAWPVGALFAAGVAFVIGKIALGLRSDYLAIATSESARSLFSASRMKSGSLAGSRM